MVAQPNWQKMTLAEYLRLESDPSAKYEYIEGYAVRMSGGSVGHARVAKNIVRQFDLHLQTGSCMAHTSDVKVLIPTINSYFLPDVTVSCVESDNREDMQAIATPRLIVEVLSPSTEAVDRGYKFQCYQTLASLEEYVLVSSLYQFVEVYRRQSAGTWSYQAYRPEQVVELRCLDMHLTFAEIYDRVRVPPKPALSLIRPESFHE